MKWEYLLVRVICTGEYRDNRGREGKGLNLNMYGDEGWEMISATAESDGGHSLFFKRPKPAEAASS